MSPLGAESSSARIVKPGTWASGQICPESDLWRFDGTLRDWFPHPRFIFITDTSFNCDTFHEKWAWAAQVFTRYRNKNLVKSKTVTTPRTYARRMTLFKRMAPVSKLSCRNFKLDESLKCKWFSFIPHPLGLPTPIYCAPRGDWHTNERTHAPASLHTSPSECDLFVCIYHRRASSVLHTGARGHIAQARLVSLSWRLHTRHPHKPTSHLKRTTRSNASVNT